MNTKKIINQVLIDNNLTQTELARKLKINREHLNKVIHGKRTSNPVKYKVAKFFKVPEEELFPEDVA